MSEETRRTHRLAVLRARVDTAIEHPLLGRHRRRSLAALGLVVAFVVATGVGLLVEQLLFTGVRHWTLAEGVETLRWATILAAPILLALSIPYAIWNGGPLVATALATAPTIATGLTRLQVVLSVDAVLGLLVASVAATLAAVVDGRRAARSAGAGGFLRPDEDGLLVASAVTVVAVVASWRVHTAPSPPTVEWIGALGPVLVLPAVGLAVGWWAWLRAGTGQ